MDSLLVFDSTPSPPPNRTSRLLTPERTSRSSSVLTRSGSPSPDNAHWGSGHYTSSNKKAVLGVCAMDVKARSRAMREILTRIVQLGEDAIEVKIFGDKVILDEDVKAWPRCDILISFFSTDFPLAKAVEYVKLRQPLCVNDLPLQELLWDRRLVGAMLDHLKIPTPTRIEVSRDGGPTVSDALKKSVFDRTGLVLGGHRPAPDVRLREDGDAIVIDGAVLEKPFVEKPVSGEDHNIYIYFKGGGGRRLFRKVGNKSSEMDPTLNEPRTEGSYIYEAFIDVDNCEIGRVAPVDGTASSPPRLPRAAEDIKVYTIGSKYTHAETRKSPVVDGVVRRNTEGKEIRFITNLTDEEKTYAAKICQAFGQRICGFDVLRPATGAKSMVIDVNGWSFVKGNESYYDKAAEILAQLCFQVRNAKVPPATIVEESTWKLKANVTVFRHADRTPKQKLKYNFPVAESWTQPFVRILNGEREEIFLRERSQLQRIADAVEEAKKLGASGEDLAKLAQLSTALFNKIDLPGTKAQLKPTYKRTEIGGARQLVKLQLVFKWGGEFTHAARYQSRDLGENMKKDISIMNKDVLNNVKIYTSSERRVTASAEIFAAALMETNSSSRSSRNLDMLSNNGTANSSPASTSGIVKPPEPIPQVHLIIRKDLLDDSNAAKDLMDDVKKRLKILLRPGESEKRPELTWPKSMKKEPVEVVKEVIELLRSFRDIMRHNYDTLDVDSIQPRWCCDDEPFLFRERWEKLFEEFCDVKQEKFDPSRVSELYDTIKYCALHHRAFLFAIFSANGGAEPGKDRQLHELYARAKALFDLVAPQEYGIEPAEKEEIGILTSLPLLRKVVEDLEAARNNEQSSLTLYFTKESHIHTLVNLVLLSGLPLVSPRIPELDYASHITFELYERNGGRDKSDKEYSIKLSLSEGAHSSNVLDSALDARHSLNVQPKRNLTQHLSYSLVIEKLSKHFHRVPVLDDDESGQETAIPVLASPLSTLHSEASLAGSTTLNGEGSSPSPA